MCIPIHLLLYMHLWCGQGKLFLLTDVVVPYFSLVNDIMTVFPAH